MSMMFASRLRFLRRANKFSQADLADRLNVSRTTYASWESGKSEPDIDMLHRICDFYDVTSDFLLCIDIKHSTPQLDQLRAELWDLIVDCDQEAVKSIMTLVKRMR